MYLHQITIQPGNTLFGLFGNSWQSIYNAPYNLEFRNKRPDPSQIEVGDTLSVQCFGDVPDGNEHNAFIFGNNFMGDDICATPVAEIFKQKNYKVFRFTAAKWCPLGENLPCIDIITSDWSILEKTYKPGDIVVCSYTHFSEYVDRGYNVLSSCIRTNYENFIKPREANPCVRRIMSHLGFDPHIYSTRTFVNLPAKTMQLPSRSIAFVIGSVYSPARRFHPVAINRLYDLTLAAGYYPIIICNNGDAHGARVKYCCDFDDRENLMQCLSLVDSVDLLVTPDSGLMHVRQSLAKPMIVCLDIPFTHGVEDLIDKYPGLSEIPQSVCGKIFADTDGVVKLETEMSLLKQIEEHFE